MGLQDIQYMNENQFADLFSQETKPDGGTSTNLFSSEVKDVNILTSTTNQTTASTTEQTTQPVSVTEETTITPLEEVNLIGEEEKKKKELEAKIETPQLELSGYFEDRIKNKLFVPLEVLDEKGEAIPFIPKTPEEVDEFINFQVDHKFESLKTDIDKAWYSEKSPAFKFIAQYAEKVTNPAELLPVLQGVNNIQTVAQIDETQIEGAEELVRLQLASSGQTKDLIDVQVETLKTSNKLLDVAKTIKPAMLQAENQRLALLKKQKDEEFDSYRNMVVDIRNNVIQVIEKPIGKDKLKNEEKAAIYDLIAEPDPETRGYRIFDKIDELYEKKDFEKLRKIALLLENEESFTNYISSSKVDKAAEALQRKIRVAGDSRTTGKSDSETPTKVISTQTTITKGGRTLFSRGQ
jgi:hypothetical protein